jgi:hypothetical protein
METRELMEAVFWEGLFQTFRAERGMRLTRRAFLAAINRANKAMTNYAHEFVRETIRAREHAANH